MLMFMLLIYFATGTNVASDMSSENGSVRLRTIRLRCDTIYPIQKRSRIAMESGYSDDGIHLATEPLCGQLPALTGASAKGTSRNSYCGGQYRD